MPNRFRNRRSRAESTCGVVIGALGFCLWGPPGHADAGKAAAHGAAGPAPVAPGRPADAGYLLDYEDVLTVTVLRHPELSSDEIMVNTSGKINLPVAGEIQVSGKTLAQVQEEVTRRLGRLLRKPE